ncbi:flagellar basal body P-ring formation protein FlgA (plasmid) [Paroceanicella profunda]|uniref:Flagella basal body P-ring formation protein FlgA n=1 Tax=Paroceanicella profunda TaxID=2579971 RepID=A0A5B8G2C7_9RHOB|nr:flagellar basal body P-ring formation chaperone FlgA [Paroceanicella profunda]QDL94765.1 flagellar basal body P-ring formation protein FlgA [Paroceanicella profunda]
MAGLLPVLLLGFLVPAALLAGDNTLVATRAVRASSVLGPDDVTLLPGSTPGALSSPEEAIGQETRAALYPGRPIYAGQVGPPALVERNATVMLHFRQGALFISTEGRALDRAGEGETVRVMNLTSRQIVQGRVAPDGSVEVGR